MKPGRLSADLEDRLVNALRDATRILEGDARHMPAGQGKVNLYTIVDIYKALLIEATRAIVIADGKDGSGAIPL